LDKTKRKSIFVLLAVLLVPHGAETPMVERRQTERLKTTSGALIFSDQQRGVLSCYLRDISDTGVGLRLNDKDVIASIFKITRDNFRTVQTCRVLWFRGRYIGATFQG
jgi:PilZ domain